MTSSTGSTGSSGSSTNLSSVLGSLLSGSSSTSSSGITVNTGTSNSGPLQSISGLISGLDTSSIIAKLMAVAGLPETNLKQDVTNDQTKIAAYNAVSAALTSLQTAAGALSDPNAWNAVSATSSDPSVGVTAGSGATAGQFTFDVTSVAAAQSEVSANAVSGLNGVVSSGGPITITQNGTTTTVTPTSGTLSAVVAAINNSGAGVRAAAVQTASGQYRLQLTAASTGAASAFTVGGVDQVGGFQTTSAASDAVLTVGPGTAGQYTITSSSNTFANAFPGLTLTVSQPATSVTVTTASDESGLSTKVQALVDAANSALSTIAGYSGYDTSTSTAGVLLGDGTVSSIQQLILGTVAGLSGPAGDVGVELTQTGSLTFNAATFAAAYTANPAGVAQAFAAHGSFTPASGYGPSGTVSFFSANPGTLPGDYPVTVTQAATQSTATIDTSGGLSAGQTVTLGTGAQSFTYTLTAADTNPTALAHELTTLAAQNNVGVTVAASGSTLQVTSIGYGSVAPMSVAAAGGLVASPVTAGQDVAGTINGVAATGVGQLLSAPATDPTLAGLVLDVTLTPADVAAANGGTVGSLAFTPGIAQQYATLAAGATDPLSGSLTQAVASVNSDITDLQTQISGWDYRLSLEQTMYQNEFNNMETQLGTLQNQAQWLNGQISSLG